MAVSFSIYAPCLLTAGGFVLFFTFLFFFAPATVGGTGVRLLIDFLLLSNHCLSVRLFFVDCIHNPTFRTSWMHNCFFLIFPFFFSLISPFSFFSCLSSLIFVKPHFISLLFCMNKYVKDRLVPASIVLPHRLRYSEKTLRIREMLICIFF